MTNIVRFPRRLRLLKPALRHDNGDRWFCLGLCCGNLVSGTVPIFLLYLLKDPPAETRTIVVLLIVLNIGIGVIVLLITLLGWRR